MAPAADLRSAQLAYSEAAVGSHDIVVTCWAPAMEENQIVARVADGGVELSVRGHAPSVRILLPTAVEATPESVSCLNGVVEVRLRRLASPTPRRA